MRGAWVGSGSCGRLQGEVKIWQRLMHLTLLNIKMTYHWNAIGSWPAHIRTRGSQETVLTIMKSKYFPSMETGKTKSAPIIQFRNRGSPENIIQNDTKAGNENIEVPFRADRVL